MVSSFSPLNYFSHSVAFLFLFYFLDEAGGAQNEEKRQLLTQLQEKSSEVARLEKQLGDLQRAAEPGSQGHSSLAEEGGLHVREQLQVRNMLSGGGAELSISVFRDTVPTLKFIQHYFCHAGGLGCP